MVDAVRTGASIEIRGVRSTRNALQAFVPDVKRRMDNTIRAALRQTRDAARSRYPKGDWVVRVNSKNLLGVIAARAGTGGGPSWAASGGGVKAAVFEFMGSRSDGSTPQARATIESLNRRYGAPGRFLWDAWDATGENVLDTIREAVLAAEAELQATLDAAGEDY